MLCLPANTAIHDRHSDLRATAASVTVSLTDLILLYDSRALPHADSQGQAIPLPSAPLSHGPPPLPRLHSQQRNPLTTRPLPFRQCRPPNGVSQRHHPPIHHAGPPHQRQHGPPTPRVPAQPSAVPPSHTRTARQPGALVPSDRAGDRGELAVSGDYPAVYERGALDGAWGRC